jgi:hypothetical protein
MFIKKIFTLLVPGPASETYTKTKVYYECFDKSFRWLACFCNLIVYSVMSGIVKEKKVAKYLPV